MDYEAYKRATALKSIAEYSGMLTLRTMARCRAIPEGFRAEAERAIADFEAARRLIDAALAAPTFPEDAA